MTNLLMERLPPDDFARSGEVQLLTLRIDFLNERTDMLQRRVDGLTSTIKVLIGSMVTVSTVMIGLLVQITLTVS
jgi:cell division protein FtsL